MARVTKWLRTHFLVYLPEPYYLSDLDHSHHQATLQFVKRFCVATRKGFSLSRFETTRSRLIGR